MSAPPPPPPPPHGEAPRSSGLPPGKYDIFVIPEHSAGSGFLYLPSLQPNVNSFAAGFASALILVAVFQSMAPAFRVWWEGFHGLGNMAITLLIFGVGFGAWSLGRTQKDGPSPGQAHQGPHDPSGGGFGASSPGANAGASAAPPPPPPPPHGDSTPPPRSQPPPPQGEKPKGSWQQRSAPQPGATKPDTPKGSWEKAREETRKKEEERKAKEAEQRRRDEAARRLAELRAKETRERLEREKERDKKEKELADKKKRELDERLASEKEARDKREQDEAAAKAAAKASSPSEAGRGRAGGSYAYSGVGEKTSMWPNGRPGAAPAAPAAAAPDAGSPPPSKAPPGPDGKKPPPAPTARTHVSADDDAHSFRPYDQPRRPARRPSASSVGGSEASWAPSHTTARTSPPPSVRGPYSTKDPDKIVIQAVYLFMNQFAKTPASQLVSGVGSVTDGLILRITTEGLFIDDDVRGVAQREWDVKAWTLKHVETGGWKAKGLHVLRATVRDQEGKRYVVVVNEAEGWKVAVGLQRLRRGTQVRQLGVGSMSPSDARGTLETLGWGE